MKYLLPLLVLLAAKYSALGRLGETEAQIEARYGAPLSKANGDTPNFFEREYKFNGFSISVIFLDGVSQSECYGKVKVAKSDSADTTAPHPIQSIITNDEVQILLKLNAAGNEWKPLDKIEKGVKTEWELYVNNKQTAVAALSSEGTLFIMTMKMSLQLQKDDIQRKEKANTQLNGF